MVGFQFSGRRGVYGKRQRGSQPRGRLTTVPEENRGDEPWREEFQLLKGRGWLYLCLAGCVAFGITEAVLEHLGFGSPALVAVNSATGYEMVPEQHVVRRRPLSDDAIAHVDTDSQGARSDEPAAAHAPGTLRILFLGDSITYGSTQVDQPHIFTELVHRELPALIHQPVEVMNASASGWAVGNEIAWVKEHTTRQADVVVLCLNSGDPSQPFSTLPASGVIPSKAYHFPKGLSELEDRVLAPEMRKTLWRLGLGSARAAMPDVDPGVVVTNNQRIVNENLKQMDDLMVYLANAHARLVVVYIPMVAQIQDPKTGAPGLEAVRKWAAEKQVPFLFASTLNQAADIDACTLRDHTHYNARGHRLIADAIEQQWSLTSVK